VKSGDLIVIVVLGGMGTLFGPLYGAIAFFVLEESLRPLLDLGHKGWGEYWQIVFGPMLVAVGMYLPFPTTFAIFVGGMLRWVTNHLSRRAGHNEGQRTRVESVGILISSGLIAGEALTGLLIATLRFKDIEMPAIFKDPSYLAGFAVMLGLGFLMVRLPMLNAGRPEDPAPPAAMM